MRTIFLAATAALLTGGCVGSDMAGPKIRELEWTATSIDGRPVIAGSQPVTLRLNPNRRAGGNAHCNIWHGTYRLGAGTISFSEIGSTRRYCPEPLMSQENRYLRIIGDADRYYVWADGTMTIASTQGQTVTFRPTGVRPIVPEVPAPAGLRFTVESEAAVPGTTITLALTNGTAYQIGYNLCGSDLEQQQDGSWRPVPHHIVCTEELRHLMPGQVARYQRKLPAGLGEGQYRFRTGVETPLNRDKPGLDQIASEPFLVRR